MAWDWSWRLPDVLSVADRGYLQSLQVSVLLFPLVGFLLFIPIRHAHFRRFGELHEYRAFVSYLCTFAFVSAMTLTVLPLPTSAIVPCNWLDRVKDNQFLPFASFYDVFHYEKRHALGWSIDGWMANRAALQIFMNFLLLAPVGFLFRALYGARFFTCLVLAFLLSLMLELTQLTGIWCLAKCPYRVFDVDDLITNTAGAIFGWALYGLFRWLPDPRASEDDLWYRRWQRKDENDPTYDGVIDAD